jgi:hypothetical protein
MTILWLWTPAVVQVQTVGDKNPKNPKNPKKWAPKNTKPEKWESNPHLDWLNNNQLDITTLLSAINQRVMPPIDAMVAIQSYENMKNK